MRGRLDDTLDDRYRRPDMTPRHDLTRRPFPLSRLLPPLLALAALLAPAAPAAAQQRETFTGTAQVTAVDLILDVHDAAGGVPADLTAADFEVLEDGEPVPVIGVEPFSRGVVAGGRIAGAPGREAEAAPDEPWNWRVVIYIDQVLSSSRSIRRACEGLAAQAGRLTELGPVEIVIARPAPEVALKPTRSARLVEQTLERLARDTPGRDELRRIRKAFVRDMLLKGEIDGGGVPTVATEAPDIDPSNPGGNAGAIGQARGEGPIIRDGAAFSRELLARASLEQELGMMQRQHDALMAWLGGYLEPGPRALLLVNDGYDLDPRQFYLTGAIAGAQFVASLASQLQDREIAADSEILARSLAAAGWVTVNLAISAFDVGETMSAEMSGRGRLGDLVASKGDTVSELPSSLVLQPLAPLNKMAAYTGGETLTGVGKLPASLERLGDRVRLTYQVSRPPDGALHAVEVRARRPGLKVKAPQWSGSPAPEAVASARARRLLTGDVDRGELPVAAALALEPEAAEAAEGKAVRRRGTFQARLDLGSLKSSLAKTPPGPVRVTMAVSFAEAAPFVHHDLVESQALAGLDAWTYTAPLSLPPGVERVSVVIEEPRTGAWGGGLAALVAELPPEVSGTGAVRTASATGLRGDEPVGEAATGSVPADLLPDRKPLVLLGPPEQVVVGRAHLEAVVSDPRIARVEFRLEGRPAATRSEPPYEAKLDFGRLPEPRTVEAVGFDAAGTEVGRDAVRVNEGAGSFRVRIIEPRGGRRVGAVDVEAEVKVPPDGRVSGVEMFWNGRSVAKLFEPPYRTRVLVPPESAQGYLTVQAVREDGSTAEDVVFLNGEGTDERVDVKLVELFTVVTDPQSRPVRDLPQEEFRVFDEGVAQKLSDFRDGAEVPLNVGLLLDTSGSMYPVLREVKRAAVDFLALALREGDRSFVVDFASRPRLAQPLTGDLDALISAVAGVEASGRSALCDALVFSLVEMQQVKGRRALVVLTDGVGRNERVSFDTCMRMVQHSGIPIYAILLAGDDPTAGPGGVSSETLTRLVEPVGGRLYHAEQVDRLGRIYRSILDELHSQYLLAYYPQLGQSATGFRMVRVEVEKPGLEARTVAGYYP
jgi:VWFA-related protein